MFEIKKVKSCPVTRGTRGVVVMKPELVGEIAGAMQEQKGIEWAVLLLGSRELDGRLIRVTGLRVPRQARSAGAVDVPEIEMGEDVVGVLHSHHSMGAFFSRTDETQLNPRFGLSIVVAEPGGKDRAGEQAIMLGFDYLAESRVELPCGRLGVVSMDLRVGGDEIQPTPTEMDWWVNGDDDLSGCEEEEETLVEEGVGYIQATCGLVDARFVTRLAVYGLGSGLISRELERETFEGPGAASVPDKLWGQPFSRNVRWSDKDWGFWQSGQEDLDWKERRLGVGIEDEQLAGTGHSESYGEDPIEWWLDEIREEWREWVRFEKLSREDGFEPGFGDWVGFLADYATEAEDELLDKEQDNLARPVVG